MNMPNDVRKRWFLYGALVLIAVVFGEDTARALLNAIAFTVPAA